MFTDLIDKLIENEINDNKIDESDRELYQCGYVMLTLEIINFSALILIGLLFQCLIYMALFAVVYIPLRSYAGGYHAPTPIGCGIFSVLLELAIAVLLRYSLYDVLLPHIYIAAFVAQIIIWFRAPVAAVNKPLSGNQKRKFQRRSRTILLFEAIAIVLCMENQFTSAGFVIAVSHIILSVLMLLPQKE